MIESGIELREIRTFLTLAEELHFRRAAERLLVTPSRVSQTIGTLERRIGARLFDRTSRSVRLTTAGEEFRAAVSEPYRRLNQAVSASRSALYAVHGTLRIAMYTESLGGPDLLPIVRAFENTYPEANVAVTTLGLKRNYLDVLRSGEVDMLATRLPVSDSDMSVGSVLTHEDRVLLVCASDPLAGRTSVTLDDLADKAVSDSPAFPREMMDELIPPVTPSGRRVRRLASSSIEDMMFNIASGKQVHLTVPSFLEYHSHPDIVAVPVANLPPSETALVWRTTNVSPNVAAFARVAAAFVQLRGQD